MFRAEQRELSTEGKDDLIVPKPTQRAPGEQIVDMEEDEIVSEAPLTPARGRWRTTASRRALLATAFGAGLGLALGYAITLALPAPTKPRLFRVVFLFTRLTEPVVQTQIATTKQGLRDLGYIEGETIAYDARDAKGDPTRFPELALEVVRLDPDLIVCQNPQAALALMAATQQIPIVFASMPGDPVLSGIVRSLAKPGGNVTGISSTATGLWAKRLQLLKEAAPAISRVAVLRDQGEPPELLLELESAAKTLGVELVLINLRTASDLEPGLAAAAANHAHALLHTQTANFVVGNSGGIPRIAEFAIQQRWPSMVDPGAGGLMAFNAAQGDVWRRAATYVDRILKGANPGDLPVEGPTGSVFRINLCTAEKLGLTVPQSVLAQATEFIRCQ